MEGLLLDTHTFIWWASEPKKLSKKVLTLCQDSNNTLILSVASVWEMQIKIQLGKLKLDAELADLIEVQRKINDLQILPVRLEHTLEIKNLEDYHKDPFDRLLLAQARVEKLIMLSNDSNIKRYSASVIW
jgi:PIN domain nuclease of toxin-antitoxin system